MRPRKLLSCVALRVVFGDALASPIKTGIGAALISRAALLISFLVVIYFPTSFAQPAPILTPQISALAKPSASVLPPALSQACPHTGLAPSATAIASTRCPAASAQSCCGACADLNAALGLASASLGDLVSLVSPEALSFVQPNAKACDAFIGQTKCLQLLEDLTCALTCNPDAGAYVSATAAGTAISVCDAFAQAVMEDCQGIDLGEVSMSRVAPDPSSFMSIVAASVTSLMGAADVTITVDNTRSCFNGTGLYPRYTACCDPLTIPPTCPPNSINSSYSSLSSRSTTSSSSSSLPSLTRVTDPDACMLGTLPPTSQPPEPAPSSEPSPGLSPEPAPPPPGPVVYPACPFTKEPPTIPKRVPTRCPAAANKTCCADCSDLGLAMRLVGTNLEDVVVLIDPSLVGFVDSGFKMCDMFTGSQMCGQAIEDLLCAITCNPDAGNYTRATADATTMSVCASYAEFFFGVCQGISIGAVPLSALITSSESFLNAIAASVMKAIGYSNINIVVEKKACFSGSQVFAPVCDLFVGQLECPFLVEAIVCGANCNPDSGSYVNSTKDGASVMLICPKFADRIFSACKGIKLGTYVLSDLIADAQAFIDTVIVNTIKVAGVPNLNVTVSNSVSGMRVVHSNKWERDERECEWDESSTQ
ncbi:unnamed protein product [Closterium sp. NIES-64]|nr:unnamed protein product [Closterium sp. NIES-64]